MSPSKPLLTFQVHIIEANSHHRYGKTCIQVMNCGRTPLAERLVQCYRDPIGYGEADRYLSFVANDYDHIYEATGLWDDSINLCLDWQHYDGDHAADSSYCPHRVVGNESYLRTKQHVKLLDRLVKKGAILDDPASVVETLLSLGAVHVERKEYTRYQSELVEARSAPVFRTSVKEVA